MEQVQWNMFTNPQHKLLYKSDRMLLNLITDLVGLFMREQMKQLTTVQEAHEIENREDKYWEKAEEPCSEPNKSQEEKKTRDEERAVKLSFGPELQTPGKKEKVGRPSLQQDPPLLLEAIADLATCKYKTNAISIHFTSGFNSFTILW